MRKKRSFKTNCKLFFKKIGNFFVGIKNAFFRLKKPVRLIIYVWTILLVVLVALIAGSNANNKKIEEHKAMEQALTNAALTYVEEQEIVNTPGKKLKIEMNQLIDFNYVMDSEITDKTCKGFTIVYYNETEDRNVANSYINCKHYTTEDYFINADI